MLTADQIEALGDKAQQIISPIADFLIGDIARRISEAGQLTSSASYQVWRLQNLGMSQQQVKREIQKRLNVSLSEVDRLMKQAAEVGYDFDIRNLPHADAVSFGDNAVVQDIVSAAVQMAREDLTNMVQTLGFVTQNGEVLPLTQAYEQACDLAFQKVTTGAQDYNSAIRATTRELAAKGIRTIDYASGVHTFLEAAVRRNVMGGLGIMQEKISQQNHDDLGCDGWEISAHAASAPDHEPIQGRQYSDAEYTALNNSLVRRIGTLNCGHAAFPIILGVNRPQYTPEELERFRQENKKGIDYEGKHYTMYEATQRQRKLEQAIRDRKRRILIDEAAGDKEQLAIDQTKLVRLNDEYARFTKAAGLRSQRERAQVTGFGVKEAGAANAGANRTHKEWLASIGAQNTSLNTLDKYLEAKYNDSPEYRLLTGYDRAVKKGDISVLTGFELYKETGSSIQSQIVGQTTSTGVEIKGFATHFIDRVIGQTSEAHPGMRCGVPIVDALDALKNPVKLGVVRTLPDGDVRQTFYGQKAAVTISVRDCRLIQTNPWKGK